MGLMMYPVLIVLCVGAVYCEQAGRPVTVTPVTSVTPTTSNSTSRFIIENKVQNLTVQYNSDHSGRNRTYVVNHSNHTEKPLIITTNKEIRLIQTPPLNDSIATATSARKNNATLQHPKEIKHHGRGHHKKDHPTHFLPTIKPESSPKLANLSKHAIPKSANLTKDVANKGSVNPSRNHNNSSGNRNSNVHSPSPNPLIKHPVQRHVQNSRTAHFNNLKPSKKNLGHASEIEMQKVEVQLMRYVETPRDNKKLGFYTAADENSDKKRPSGSSQMFEMRFHNESAHSRSEPKQMDKYKVRSKQYHNSIANYENIEKLSSTAAPVQYLTPPPPVIYTVRPKILNVNNISITTAAPQYKKFNTSSQLAADIRHHSGPRDFSCLRCFGQNKPHKNYKYPTYTNKRDPVLEGNRDIKLLGPDGDNFLGGSKHHYVVTKPDEPKQNHSSSQKEKIMKRPDTQSNKLGQNPAPVRPESSSASGRINTQQIHPKRQNLESERPPRNLRNPFVLMDGLGSHASPDARRPGTFTVPEEPIHETIEYGGSSSTKHHSPPWRPYTKDLSGNYASSNFRGPTSPFKLDPSSGLYNLDEELQVSASSMRKHHPEVMVETKEIHIPVPEIIETRVPYPIHVKVDRLVPVHIDKPYPVHVEKKVPVPVKINVPQPYPVEKEVPYPVKIPIEVPRPVEVAKPVPYLVENPVPVQVFKHVKVPVRVPVDVPVPYKVHLEVEKRVPYFVQKKVPFEVPVPVEKPYLVEVKKPFEVPQEKPQPVTVERKIPVPVQVVEFVKVPIPVRSPHEQNHEQNYQHIQHRSGKLSEETERSLSLQGTHLVRTQTHHKSGTHSPNDQSQSTNQDPAKMEVVLPNMISLEFPADYGHQPTGPSSGFLPTSGART